MRQKVRVAKCAAWAFLIALLASLGANAASAAAPADGYWPQWRGPLGTGVGPEAKPPVEWGPDKNIKWQVNIPGDGSSTPIVWGDQIFIHTAINTKKKIELPGDDPEADAKKDAPAPAAPPGGKGGKGPMFNIEKPSEIHQFVLMSLDRKTGQEQWRKIAAEQVPHEGHHPDHGYASYSPATDGTCVVSFFGSRGLHCYDMQGNLKWEKDLGKMRTIFSFGEGSSPALFGNVVVITWDHEDGSFIVAFDKNTGEELWRKDRDEKTAWATPVIVPYDGQNLVVTSGNQKARAYNLANGDLVWECNGLTRTGIPSPVYANGIVYLMTGFQSSSLLAIRLGGSGDITGTDSVVWKFDKDTPYVPSPLLYDNRLYCYKSNQPILSCFDATTGNRLFGPERLDGMKGVYASPVGADGRVYLTGREGTTVVIKNSDKLEVLATNTMEEGIDASPALVGKELFLRGREHLFCIEEK